MVSMTSGPRWRPQHEPVPWRAATKWASRAGEVPWLGTRFGAVESDQIESSPIDPDVQAFRDALVKGAP